MLTQVEEPCAHSVSRGHDPVGTCERSFISPSYSSYLLTSCQLSQITMSNMFALLGGFGFGKGADDAEPKKETVPALQTPAASANKKKKNKKKKKKAADTDEAVNG